VTIDAVTLRGVGAVGAFGMFATIMAWFLTRVGEVTLSRQNYWAAAVICLVSSVIAIVIRVAEMRALLRMKKYGRTTDAIITKVKERYVSSPLLHWWVTTVKVSFEVSGCAIRAEYTESRTRARGEQEGQSILIVYDPKNLTFIRSFSDLSYRDRGKNVYGEIFLTVMYLPFISWVLVDFVRWARG